MDRRQFIHYSAASLALTATATTSLPVSAHQTTLPNGWRLSTFSDGEMRLPVSMLFQNVPTDELDAILAASGSNGTEMRRPLNVVLLETGDKTILFDAGSGTNFLSGLGELPTALDEAGLDICNITDVVFTHAHPDHIWGIVDDFDDLLMPDAQFYISEAEWAFWDSDAALAAMPAGRENFAVGAKSRFDLIRDNVSLFAFGDEVLPAIEAVNSVGHTPGHAAFTIHGGGAPIMVLGDALTHPVISFAHHEWVNESDMDGALAAQTRQRLLDQITADDMLISGYHLPAPGLGKAEKSGSAYRYNAINA